MSHPTTTPDAPVAAEIRPCQVCGSAVPWHRILIAGMDMSAALPCRCSACEETYHKNLAAAEQARRVETAMQSLDCVPPEMKATDLTHPEWNHKSWEVIKNFDVSLPQGILMYGEAGLCKSRFLALLLKRAALRGMSVSWITCDALHELADAMQSFKTRQIANEQLARHKAAQRLVIDDLGKHPMTTHTEGILFRLLDHRYNYQLPSYVSANTHPSILLEEKYFTRDRGAPIVGRILDKAIEYHITPRPH